MMFLRLRLKLLALVVTGTLWSERKQREERQDRLHILKCSMMIISFRKLMSQSIRALEPVTVLCTQRAVALCYPNPLHFLEEHALDHSQ